MVYLGYVLPRLEAQTANTALAAALVTLCWGPLQHPTLPALPAPLEHGARLGVSVLDRWALVGGPLLPVHDEDLAGWSEEPNDLVQEHWRIGASDSARCDTSSGSR
jgi:hypothetical protein